jgi:hypothetical protein
MRKQMVIKELSGKTILTESQEFKLSSLERAPLPKKHAQKQHQQETWELEPIPVTELLLLLNHRITHNLNSHQM